MIPPISLSVYMMTTPPNVNLPPTEDNQDHNRPIDLYENFSTLVSLRDEHNFTDSFRANPTPRNVNFDTNLNLSISQAGRLDVKIYEPAPCWHPTLYLRYIYVRGLC